MNVLCFAFVLVVLFAASGGLPGIERAAGGGDNAVAVAIGGVRQARQQPPVIAAAQQGVVVRPTVVRITPRTRCVAQRGLPPARAPTA